MHIIQIDRLTINHAGREIFRDLIWAIGDHDRVGLVGPNGVGKSSLLQRHHGPRDARLRRGHPPARRQRAGYLPQEVHAAARRRCWTSPVPCRPSWPQVEAELRRIEAQLGDPAVYNNPDRLARGWPARKRRWRAYDRLGGARHASGCAIRCSRLGFTPDDFDLDTVGAERRTEKAGGAGAADRRSSRDVLLLDEPDNHLDLAGKGHLEAFIRDYPRRGGHRLARPLSAGRGGDADRRAGRRQADALPWQLHGLCHRARAAPPAPAADVCRPAEGDRAHRRGHRPLRALGAASSSTSGTSARRAAAARCSTAWRRTARSSRK